jgi:hypothetical protein
MHLKLNPPVLNESAWVPTAALSVPVVFETKALFPTAVLLDPVVFNAIALKPMAALKFPDVLASSARNPNPVFSLPVVTLPAWYPKKVLAVVVGSILPALWLFTIKFNGTFTVVPK